FREFVRDLGIKRLYFIPISALEGENVVGPGSRTPWYKGGSLLDLLETVPIDTEDPHAPMRFPVQYVIRPELDFRGYAGQISSGTIHKGDPVMVLPSGRTSRVRDIITYDGSLESAFSGMSVTITLENEIDISRGDLLVEPSRMPHVSRRFEAQVVWMHSEPLEPGKPFLIKHTTQQVPAAVSEILHKTDIQTLSKLPTEKLELNEIGTVRLETRKPLFFDPYLQNRTTGAFILIDPVSNLTVGAGMITDREAREERLRTQLFEGIEFERSRLTPAERWERAGHRPVTVWLTARLDLAYMLERELFDRGCLVHVLTDDVESRILPDLARISSAAGLITICSVASDEAAARERARTVLGVDSFVEFDPSALSPRDDTATAEVTAELENRGFIGKDERGIDGEGI
ncbi:MAG: sulfate adenylyltransferase, partial [Bryobacteraceae bacterium]|nr:sulfate adenylyltransferase [Bryobacteraceae bacterium]